MSKSERPHRQVDRKRLTSGHHIEFNTRTSHRLMGEFRDTRFVLVLTKCPSHLASSVDFPSPGVELTSSGFHAGPASPVARRPPHLPFRRISMPTAPSPAVLAQIRTANL